MSPTIWREDGFAFRVFFEDHDPPHVHVVRGEVEVKIGLAMPGKKPFIIGFKGMSLPDVMRALRLVGRHQEDLLAKWGEING